MKDWMFAATCHSVLPRANGLPPRRRPDALVRNLLWMLRASSSLGREPLGALSLRSSPLI
jgi:hypothetical protein